ncbi:DNA methyltransferase [Sphingorhabdus arenilitoris]|uniref:DNA methyltransferase n=1 Tax=Sphingorhabdus arenilitoris TaxID=1490041 RepID=A0ABV8REP4_9SPHN
MIDFAKNSGATASRYGEILHSYAAIENQTVIENEDARTTYRSAVNFIESMQVSRHRWFPYKEGFSPSFVREFIGEFAHETGIIFDPFSGSGTTALVAAGMGRPAIGFDVSALTTFIARTKALVLDESELALFRLAIEEFKSVPLRKMATQPENATVCSYFYPEHLAALLRVKAYYRDVSNASVASLIKLAFLGAIEPFSTHRKAGNGVKRKKKFSRPPNEEIAFDEIRQFVVRQLEIYFEDIKSDSIFNPPEYRLKSSLNESGFAFDEKISCVLTSPPYANCFDYSKIYMSELWLGDFFQNKNDQADFRTQSVRSHVHASWDPRNSEFGSDLVDRLIKPQIEEQKLWSPKIGTMLSGYFQDLGHFLVAIKPMLAAGAPLGFVVGNSFYGGVTVATDLILADLARKHGYAIDRIRVYRGVIPSSQQYRNMGANRKYMRESLVVIRNA